MRIGIIAAMKEELSSFKSSLENIETKKIGTLEYYTGTMNGHDVALILCGIGKVNATAGCTQLIDKHQPDLIINSGVAGGFSKNLNIGDIVVANELGYHDVDVTAFGYVHGQIPDMPALFVPEKKYIDQLVEAGKAMENCEVVAGPIMSGDAFVHKQDQIDEIIANFPQISACEMESTAIAQTCQIFTTEYAIVRSISDLVFRDKSEEGFLVDLEAAAEKSVELVKRFVKIVEV